MKGKVTSFNFILVFFVSLGSFLYGFNSSIMGTVFGLPYFYSYFNLDTTGPRASFTNNILGGKDNVLPSTVNGLIELSVSACNGLYSAGGIFGCICLPWLANSLGRKVTIQITCAVCVVAATLQCAAVQIAMLLVGRFFGGFG